MSHFVKTSVKVDAKTLYKALLEMQRDYTLVVEDAGKQQSFRIVANLLESARARRSSRFPK